MERHFIKSPPCNKAINKWASSHSELISSVNHEVNDQKQRSNRCTSHKPIYVTVFIVGILLFTVGIYLIVLGHRRNEKDDVILGSCLMFSGLCFSFVSVYRTFTTIYSKTMDTYDAAVNVSYLEATSSKAEDQEVYKSTVCIFSRRKHALENGILKCEHFENSRNKKNKSVYFNTDQSHEERNENKVVLLKKSVMNDQNSGSNDIHQFNTPNKYKQESKNVEVDHQNIKVNYGIIKSLSTGTKLQVHTEKSHKSKGNTQRYKSIKKQSPVLNQVVNRRHNSHINGCSHNNKVSQNVEVLVNSSTSRDVPVSRGRLKPQLKVVIEGKSDKESIHVSDPDDINDFRTEPSHRVNTVVDLCIHNTNLKNMCDSGQSSIDSVSIMDLEENIFLQSLTFFIAPPLEFSDDIQSCRPKSGTLTYDCMQQTQKKHLLSERSQNVSPSINCSNYKPLLGLLTFDDHIEVLSD